VPVSAPLKSTGVPYKEQHKTNNGRRTSPQPLAERHIRQVGIQQGNKNQQQERGIQKVRRRLLGHSEKPDADHLTRSPIRAHDQQINSKEAGKQRKLANHSPASFQSWSRFKHNQQMMHPDRKAITRAQQQKTEASVSAVLSQSA
jgi:hypothetical protein